MEMIELGYAGFTGDQQAGRRVHGGPEKAVHLYPARHYGKLAARFPEAALSEATAHWREHQPSLGELERLAQTSEGLRAAGETRSTSAYPMCINSPEPDREQTRFRHPFICNLEIPCLEAF